MNNYDPLLHVRFIGEELDVKSMPIYELGTVLIAIQRIVNKAYLFNKGSLEKGSRLGPEERKECSLQIGEHNKSSDAYTLISFFTDPVVIDHVKTLIIDGLVALGAYAAGRAVSKKKKDASPNQIYIGSIYNEVTVINDRINNIGGVDKIEIRGNKDAQAEPVLFNSDTQNYVRQLVNETYLGELQNLEGTITKLYPNRLIVEIKVAPNYYTKVYLSDSDFDNIRYSSKTGDVIEFVGQPIYKLGQETTKIREFQADFIQEIRNEDW